jgi:DNA-binding response OmpR family regulator
VLGSGAPPIALTLSLFWFIMAVVCTAAPRVVIVSADERLVATVEAILQIDAAHCEHSVPRAATGECAIVFRPDVVVLDRFGASNVRDQMHRFRRRWPTAQIVVVNVESDDEIARLLDAGADDVVAADSILLAARLRASARHAYALYAGARVTLGDIVFDREARRVWCAGREVELTPREQAVLDCLLWYAPDVVTVAAIADFVWGDKIVATRRGLVEVYIGRLRQKLIGSRIVQIQNVRNLGYQFAGFE